MFKKKMKVEVNDNFNMIHNYIISAVDPIKFSDLLQYCIDYDLYKELYVNLPVFRVLIEEKNLSFSKPKYPEDIL